MVERKLYKWSGFVICMFMLNLALPGQEILAQEKHEHLFSTWEGFEPDKCASIWLIQRFIDPSAVIRFFPKGEPIDEGIPFDVPDAKFRRYAQMSTFESLLQHYNLIDDPKLVYIGKIIHDIEINIWEQKICPETGKVQDSIARIIIEIKDDRKVIEKGNTFFDSFYKELKLPAIKTKSSTQPQSNKGTEK